MMATVADPGPGKTCERAVSKEIQRLAPYINFFLMSFPEVNRLVE